MRASPLAALTLTVVGGCASMTPAGPDAETLTALIAAARPGATPEIRAVKCDFIAEEGSEWACLYRQRAADGRWVALETYVAADRTGWLLIDTPSDPDAPSP